MKKTHNTYHKALELLDQPIDLLHLLIRRRKHYYGSDVQALVEQSYGDILEFYFADERLQTQYFSAGEKYNIMLLCDARTNYIYKNNK
jgi:hypothetical protein